jgi:hypothetical protein
MEMMMCSHTLMYCLYYYYVNYLFCFLFNVFYCYYLHLYIYATFLLNEGLYYLGKMFIITKLINLIFKYSFYYLRIQYYVSYDDDVTHSYFN